MILAAGVASRYGSLKQLEPMGPGGEALLEYSAFDAHRCGFGRVILVVRPETEASFRATVGARIARWMPVSYVHQSLDLPADAASPADFGSTGERRKPWGTAHAVLAAAKEIAGTPDRGLFAVINADDFYGLESFQALGDFFATAASSELVFAMPGFDLEATLTDSGPVSRALCRVSDGGWLEDIVECHGLVKDGAGTDVVSMNMWAFTPALLPELRRLFADFLESADADSEFLLPDAVRRLVREGRARIKVLARAGEWCGVTFREDRERVVQRITELVKLGTYPDPLSPSP